MTQGMSQYYSFKDQSVPRIQVSKIPMLCIDYVQLYVCIFRRVRTNKVHTDIHINTYMYVREGKSK